LGLPHCGHNLLPVTRMLPPAAQEPVRQEGLYHPPIHTPKGRWPAVY
jgi:hypothetical protein